jgi:hypothetical protein
MRHRTRTTLLLLLVMVEILTLPLIPRAAAAADNRDWNAGIAEMDRALALGQAPAATAAWQDAYVAAHLSRGWVGMVAVGDAALRAARATGAPELFEPRARRAYLTALLRARRQASREGVLAAADGFSRLGDREAEQIARSEAADLTIRAGASAETRRRRAGAPL